MDCRGIELRFLRSRCMNIYHTLRFPVTIVPNRLQSDLSGPIRRMGHLQRGANDVIASVGGENESEGSQPVQHLRFFGFALFFRGTAETMREQGRAARVLGAPRVLTRPPLH